MFHVELRRFPNVTRAFNLTREQLQQRILVPWVEGLEVEVNDYRWAPDRTRLSIYEGPALATEEMGLGRGWANATRAGTDVTEAVLAAARQAAATPSAVEELKDAVLELARGERISLTAVIELTERRHPQARISERMGLAERTVWELLHERRLALLRDAVRVEQAQWEPLLLSWAAWVGPRAAELEGDPQGDVRTGAS